MKNFVYFFSAGDRIKVGISKNVLRRLGDVSRTSGLSLTHLGAIPGSYALERFIHEKLAAHRLEGEWFKDCDEVQNLIRATLRGGGDAIGFVEPPKKVVPTYLQHKRTPEDWVKMDHGLLEIMWPGNGYQEFAAFAEVPVEQVTRWFRGEEQFPRVYRAAFASLVVMFTFGDEPAQSWLPKSEEAA